MRSHRALVAVVMVANGFKVVLKNRNVRVPYMDFGAFGIQEWRKIGVEAPNHYSNQKLQDVWLSED